MAKKTILLVLSHFVLAALLLIVTYFWIDRSITLTYTSLSYDTAQRSVDSLSALIATEWKGMSETQVQRKLERLAAQLPNDHIVVKKEGETISFDQVAFNFKDGKLDSVGSHGR